MMQFVPIIAMGEDCVRLAMFANVSLVLMEVQLNPLARVQISSQEFTGRPRIEGPNSPVKQWDTAYSSARYPNKAENPNDLQGA